MDRKEPDVLDYLRRVVDEAGAGITRQDKLAEDEAQSTMRGLAIVMIMGCLTAIGMLFVILLAMAGSISTSAMWYLLLLLWIATPMLAGTIIFGIIEGLHRFKTSS